MNIYKVELNNGHYRYATAISSGEAEKKVLSYYSPTIELVRIERIDVGVIMEEKPKDK